MIPWLDEGTRAWNAATGGTAVQDNVTFAEKQIKQAGIIATQDSSWDMMYMTEAYGYISKFGARLLLQRSRRTRFSAGPRASSSRRRSSR